MESLEGRNGVKKFNLWEGRHSEILNERILSYS